MNIYILIISWRLYYKQIYLYTYINLYFKKGKTVQVNHHVVHRYVHT